MTEVDLKAESVNNYIAEFLQEIDQQFLDPNFSTYRGVYECIIL